MDKKHPGQNPPVKNLCELRQTPCKYICTYACTPKNRGSEMCDIVWLREGESKLVQNSVVFFMDGP